MPGMPHLVCPLCRTDVAAGSEPVPGRCPGCAAQFAGGGDDARGAVAAALERWGIAGLDPVIVADGLFRIPPGEPLGGAVAVTSDRREGFYKWWVFVADAELPAPVLARAAAYSPGASGTPTI